MAIDRIRTISGVVEFLALLGRIELLCAYGHEFRISGLPEPLNFSPTKLKLLPLYLRLLVDVLVVVLSSRLQFYVD